MFILNPDSCSCESSYDELDEFLEMNNFKKDFNKEDDETYANLCDITNLYFGMYFK